MFSGMQHLFAMEFQHCMCMCLTLWNALNQSSYYTIQSHSSSSSKYTLEVYLNIYFRLSACNFDYVKISLPFSSFSNSMHDCIHEQQTFEVGLHTHTHTKPYEFIYNSISPAMCAHILPSKTFSEIEWNWVEPSCGRNSAIATANINNFAFSLVNVHFGSFSIYTYCKMHIIEFTFLEQYTNCSLVGLCARCSHFRTSICAQQQFETFVISPI